MSFVVSARKYRPQNFDELIGQDHIATTLKNAILNDKLAHAFLFSGPRGVGKTTTARILAKVLNCTDRKDSVNACNECAACKSFSDNASFNIFELDAASNNSVDHIRALNDQVRFQPQQGSYKIYIIDEVHMLSQAAFNAFLKTLEEPPPYAKFILATTEKHKIIPTILSRCQTFDFKRIAIKDIVEQLQGIAEKEGKEIDDQSYHLIAEKADGAMRDALSIYDKVTSSISGAISYAQVARDLNELDKDHYFRIVDHALKEDLGSIIKDLDDIVKNGFEIEQFCSGFMVHLRSLLFIQDDRLSSILEMSKSILERYSAQAQLCSPSFLLTALNIMDRLDMNLPRIQNKRLSTEIALSKIAYMNRVVDKKKTKVGIKDQAAESKAPGPKAHDFQAQDSEIAPPQAAPAEKAPTVPKETLSQKSVEIEHIPKEKRSKLEEVKAAATSVKTEKPIPEPEPSVISVSKSVDLPKLDLDINGLIASIQDEETKQKQVKNPFTKEHIQSVLAEWKTQTQSNALATALNFVKLELKKGEILILTPLQLYAEMIKQDSGLMQQIRDQYPLEDLKFEFRVDMEAFPEVEPPKQRRLLSFPEKYEKLKEKNPAFETLFNELKLRPKK